MASSYLTPQQWLRVSGTITGGETFAARYERFPAFFGVKLAVAMAVWRFFIRNGMLLNKENRGFSPKHLLWTCLFLFKYEGEKFLSALCGTTRKTYRKWIWIGCTLLFDLDPVSSLRLFNCILCFPLTLLFYFYRLNGRIARRTRTGRRAW